MKSAFLIVLLLIFFHLDTDRYKNSTNPESQMMMTIMLLNKMIMMKKMMMIGCVEIVTAAKCATIVVIFPEELAVRISHPDNLANTMTFQLS